MVGLVGSVFALRGDPGYCGNDVGLGTLIVFMRATYSRPIVLTPIRQFDEILDR